ncbi:MAG: 4-hydroxythreonine-4-phosphate dehydrogenase PdxA [Holophagales bacterium]|nr:4-hydroxythreonine-4-phosphate dehydrogenase PdxA [Holophagales bacterium]
MEKPTLVFSQGDPAGIGPEILVRVVSEGAALEQCRPILIVEEAALASLEGLAGIDLSRLRRVEDTAQALALPAGEVPFLDPVPGSGRRVRPGQPTAADARGALTALDLAIDSVSAGQADALVTAPISKARIAEHLRSDFRGHTDYLAERAGLRRYGRDYLMTFLAPGLRVALLSTHVPLEEAIAMVTEENLLDALRCLHRGGIPRNGGGRIAVAGLDPHAGEGGLLGFRDQAIVRPAVTRARGEGIDAHGPESADSLFARARRGAFDWVLALYHDQGLIAVKTAAFGRATNWTSGLPYLRTSVDHGTAYDIAGTGRADPSSLRAVIESTVSLVEETRSSEGEAEA